MSLTKTLGLASLFLAASLAAYGQAPQGARGGAAGGRAGGAAGGGGAQQNAPMDLTGYWVAVIAEDWEFRMVTPNKGVYDTLNLNAEGRRVGDSWDPAKDEAAGEQCRAYGAGNIMRMPGRLHVTWENNNTLKVETDTGTQTRLFRFGAGNSTPTGEPSWQGNSAAEWEIAGGARGAPRAGSLKIVTTNLKPGYVRRNGAPYSKNAVVTEFWDVNALPNGDRWLTVTTKVDDPTYFTRPLVLTTDFKKLADAAGWNPTPCSAK
jgi:hypothetical protein